MEINKNTIEKIVREVLNDKLSNCTENSSNGIEVRHLPNISLGEDCRFDTGYSFAKVYTKDVLTLEESPRLGCGLMEMNKTKFDWTLNYDEIDYIIEGKLEIICNGIKSTATKGEIIYIPKGSKISFSVDEYARFMYVTYPADWSNQ